MTRVRGTPVPGIALPQSDVFGYFSIPALTQNPSNPEVFIKVLDATALPGQGYWIFYGFLTDLVFDLTVRENATGRTKVFHKDAGQQLNGFDTTTFIPGAATTRETEAISATPNAFVRTAVDLTNHTQASITADVQYTYKCTSTACSPANEFNSSAVKRFTLGPFANFHFDDIVQALADQGALTSPASSRALSARCSSRSTASRATSAGRRPSRRARTTDSPSPTRCAAPSATA